MNKTIRESEYLFAWFVFWITSLGFGYTLSKIADAFFSFVLSIVGVHSDFAKTAWLIVPILVSYGLFRLIVGVMIVKKAEKNLQNLSIAPASPIA